MSRESKQADLVIRNARLIDGTGAPGQRGGLAIRDDRIVALGDLNGWTGARDVDASGHVLSPGFIDVHTHDDRALIANPTMDCKVSQGVTTVVAGNCGVSLAPLAIDRRPPAPIDLISEDPRGFFSDFADYLDHLDDEPPATNVLAQVGHSSLRIGAMDDLERPATAGEVAAMRRLLEQSLEAGAIGLSTGLFYPPAKAAPTEEVIELAKALHQAKALHTTHMRDEADHVIDSLEETFRVGREAQIPVVISHHKCAGQRNHGRSCDTLKLIDENRAHQHIGLDAYPYVAGSTMLDSSLLEDASKVIVTWSVPHPEAAGRDLQEIAADWGIDMEEAVARLTPAGGVFFMMDEADVQRILAYPHTMIGSDGLPHDTQPHPRLWGTFPRVLGHYCRDLQLFSLEEAVRKMTGLPASEFGLTDRGRLAVGAAADLVLFDPDEVIDAATFEAPKTPARGILEVWVNGRSVWRDGGTTGARPGRALRLHSLSLPSHA